MRSLQLRLNASGRLLPDSASVSWDDSCLTDLQWWSVESHLLVGLPLDLPQPDLALYTDASDSGWGTFLTDDHLSGSWTPTFSTFSINHRELLAVLYGVQGFLPVLRGRSASLFVDNTTALSCLRKQGGTLLNSELRGPVCSSSLRGQSGSPDSSIYSRSHERTCRFPQSPLPGPRLGVDPLSSFRELLRRWPATIDLFATSMNACLPVYFAPIADPQSAGTDAMMQSWDDLQAYAFPPFGLLHCVLSKVWQSRGLELTLVALFWLKHPWFPDLLELLVAVPVFLPQRKDLLRQPHFHHFHQNLPVLRLTAFHISSDPQEPSASHQQWLVNLPTADELPPG